MFKKIAPKDPSPKVLERTIQTRSSANSNKRPSVSNDDKQDNPNNKKHKKAPSIKKKLTDSNPTEVIILNHENTKTLLLHTNLITKIIAAQPEKTDNWKGTTLRGYLAKLLRENNGHNKISFSKFSNVFPELFKIETGFAKEIFNHLKSGLAGNSSVYLLNMASLQQQFMQENQAFLRFLIDIPNKENIEIKNYDVTPCENPDATEEEINTTEENMDATEEDKKVVIEKGHDAIEEDLEGFQGLRMVAEEFYTEEMNIIEGKENLQPSQPVLKFSSKEMRTSSNHTPQNNFSYKNNNVSMFSNNQNYINLAKTQSNNIQNENVLQINPGNNGGR